MGADEGVITELNEDGGHGDIAGPRGRAKANASYPRAGRNVRRQVQPLLDLNLPPARIADLLNLPIKTVNRAVGRLNRQQWRQVGLDPDAEKGRHYRILNRVVEDSLAPGAKAADRAVVIKALERISRLRGLEAPTVGISLGAQIRVNPDAQQALVNNPEYCELVMRLEELERAATQGQGHVAGAVRGIAEPGPMALRAPPRDPQPEDGRRGQGRDPSPGELPAAEDRQVGIPIGQVPGVVSRHLPGSEGDLGRL